LCVNKNLKIGVYKMIDGLSIRPSFQGFCEGLGEFFKTGSLASFQLTLIFYNKEGGEFNLRGKDLVLLDTDLEGVDVTEVFNKTFPRINGLSMEKIAPHSPFDMLEVLTSLVMDGTEISLDSYETPQKWMIPEHIREIALEEVWDVVAQKVVEMFDVEAVECLLIRLYQGSRKDGWLEVAATIKLTSPPVEGESIGAFKRAIESAFRAKGPIAYFEVIRKTH
jgi:hypothetical protein